MKKFINYIRDRYQKLAVLILFVISLGLMVLSFPRQLLFSIDYEQGEVWNRKTLTTFFDFSIIKTEDQLKKDQAEIELSHNIYYRFDESKKNIPLKKIEDEIRKNWEESSMSIEQISIIEGLFVSENRDSIRLEKHVKVGLATLEKIFDQGVIDIYSEHEKLESNRLITILKGSDKTHDKLSNIFTYSSACEYAEEELRKINKIDDSFLLSYIRTNIKTNVLFEEEQTKKELEFKINNIPLKKGKIEKGADVIKKGETITPENYQKLNSYKDSYEKQSQFSQSYWLKILGELIIVAICLVLIFYFIKTFEPKVLKHIGQIFFILLLNVLIVALFSFTLPIEELSTYLIPICIYPIILRAFYKVELALFLHISLVFIISLMVPDSFEFVLLHGITGSMLMFSNSNQTRRAQFINSAVLLFISYSVIYFGIKLLKASPDISSLLTLKTISWTNFGWFGGNALLSLFAYPLIYLFEKTFGLLSEMSLVELADTNSPLLRELNEKAPGTFQHSSQVANLAEEAVREINGDALLTRAGAMYHDIGKMKSPEYFIENQNSSYNPHDDLDSEESTKIIIDHVIYGIELGKKYKLPDQLLSFIRTHHGTTKVAYFYHKKVQEVGVENVNPADYTYPGPLPFSKETAVLMMADSVEAASRSITDISSDKIDNLIDKIISNQMNAGQFMEADITFKDITKIKKIFARKLKTIYHVRIEYPE